tara:strand:+ start:1408 stop:1608 length:201 start_codon:yes stop_codon:yes gene_type:complete
MAEKSKTTKTKKLYQAVEPERFKQERTATVPYYEKLSKGEAVEVDIKNPHVQVWLDNNVITLAKEK